MSTAARPTFHAAIGKSSYGGSSTRAVSAKDQAAHTKLKFRQPGQSTVSEMASTDLKAKLAILEQKNSKHKVISSIPDASQEVEKESVKLLTNEAEINLEEIKRKYDDEDVDYGEQEDLDDDKDDDGFDSSRYPIFYAL